MARKENTTEAAFDVSQTDKRSDKRVLVDYVFAKAYAPHLLPYFSEYSEQLEAALVEIAAAEGATEVSTPVDTLIEQQSELLTARYEGAYADYVLRGNAASFFVPKAKRVAKSPAKKAEDIVASASPEQLEALAALLKARGIETAV